MVEVWKCHIIPSETRGGARLESRYVVGEVGDNHSKKFRRETAQLAGVAGGFSRISCECALELGLGTVPEDTGDTLDSYDNKSNTEHRGEGIKTVC